MAKKNQYANHQTKSKPGQVIRDLSDLSILFSQTQSTDEAAQPQPSPQEKKQAYNEFRNSTYTIVSIVAYLIGIGREHFGPESGAFLEDTFSALEDNRDARIIRNLCRIRAAMERNYAAIVNEFTTNITNIGSVPDLIPSDAVTALAADGVQLYKSRPEIDEYLIMINTELSNRINSAASLFPEWIKWDYVKPIFLMPGGTKKEGIQKAGAAYNSNRQRYPFQCWINWDAVGVGTESKGNILYNDEKFVTILYERHEDRFENLSLVRDAGNQTMRNLNSLLERCRSCVIVVDCENSDAVKLAAALSSLPAEQLNRVRKVLLFDSEYTTDQWKTFVDRQLRTALNVDVALELEHIVVPRLNQNKSQVDMSLAVRTSKEVYTRGVDAVILVSSDSDYWAMIQQLEDVKFLVMLERSKTGVAIMDTLTLHEIPFCFIDDFCTAATYAIKTTTLINGIQEQIDRVLAGQSDKPLNVRTIMEETLQSSWIDMTPKEREAFYSRYLQRMKLNVSPDGAVSIVIT